MHNIEPLAPATSPVLAPQAKLLTLRAAVDHLAGEGCTVRQVDVVATLDAPPPSVARGMATRLVRDRQVGTAQIPQTLCRMRHGAEKHWHVTADLKLFGTCVGWRAPAHIFQKAA